MVVVGGGGFLVNLSVARKDHASDSIESYETQSSHIEDCQAGSDPSEGPFAGVEHDGVSPQHHYQHPGSDREEEQHECLLGIHHRDECDVGCQGSLGSDLRLDVGGGR